jgi:nucleoside-diphosphate-sugar epimerase
VVIGASGFLGFHVKGQLAQRGDDVRILLRQTSSTQAIDDLDVERQYGDIFDDDALRAAMSGVDDVFHCAVDTRAWLRDRHRCSAPTDSEVVGVEDAAAALLLAADKGRNGERYIISDRMMTAQELYETAADAAGTNPPRFGVPLWVMFLFRVRERCDEPGAQARLGTDKDSVRLMHVMPRLDHGKAERELGWRPAPVHDSIRRAAEFYREHRRKLKAA